MMVEVIRDMYAYLKSVEPSEKAVEKFTSAAEKFSSIGEIFHRSPVDTVYDFICCSAPVSIDVKSY